MHDGLQNGTLHYEKEGCALIVRKNKASAKFQFKRNDRSSCAERQALDGRRAELVWGLTV